MNTNDIEHHYFQATFQPAELKCEIRHGAQYAHQQIVKTVIPAAYDALHCVKKSNQSTGLFMYLYFLFLIVIFQVRFQFMSFFFFFSNVEIV